MLNIYNAQMFIIYLLYNEPEINLVAVYDTHTSYYMCEYKLYFVFSCCGKKLEERMGL